MVASSPAIVPVVSKPIAAVRVRFHHKRSAKAALPHGIGIVVMKQPRRILPTRSIGAGSATMPLVGEELPTLATLRLAMSGAISRAVLIAVYA
jgi:hypothetical protein